MSPRMGFRKRKRPFQMIQHRSLFTLFKRQLLGVVRYLLAQKRNVPRLFHIRRNRLHNPQMIVSIPLFIALLPRVAFGSLHCQRKELVHRRTIRQLHTQQFFHQRLGILRHTSHHTHHIL